MNKFHLFHEMITWRNDDFVVILPKTDIKNNYKVVFWKNCRTFALHKQEYNLNGFLHTKPAPGKLNSSMSKVTEVASFLKNFKEKMKIWDVLFRDDRGKNAKALVELELRPIERKNVLEALEEKDYNEGPLEEKLYGGADMWVFGKTVKKKEVYIKITLGAVNSGVICISFHLAEHKMNYPLK